MGLFEDFILPVGGLLSFLLLEKSIPPVLLFWIHFQRAENIRAFPPKSENTNHLPVIPDIHNPKGDFRRAATGVSLVGTGVECCG